MDQWRQERPKDYAFLPRELDRFLSELLVDADERWSDDPAFDDIQRAQKRAMCGTETVLRLLLDRKLERVGKRRGVAGYSSVLVDSAEVELKLERPPREGVAMTPALKVLKVGWLALDNLIKDGILTVEYHPNPKNKRPRRAIPQKGIDRFHERFASIKMLADERGTNWVALKKELEAAGISPAFDPSRIETDIYRRSDLQ